jgi:hypothetical protein
MGMILGFTNAITNVATGMTYHFSPLFSKSHGVNFVFLVSLGLCSLSLIAAFVVLLVEKKVTDDIKKNWLLDITSKSIEDRNVPHMELSMTQT